jgi:hypothetical protein
MKMTELLIRTPKRLVSSAHWHCLLLLKKDKSKAPSSSVAFAEAIVHQHPVAALGAGQHA